MRVEPHFTQVRKIAYLSGILVSAVGDGAKCASTVSDVGDHLGVIKHRYGALRVEEDPVGIYLVFVLRQHKSVLKEGSALSGLVRLRIGGLHGGRAVTGIMPEGLTGVAAHVGEGAPASVWNDCGLGERVRLGRRSGVGVRCRVGGDDPGHTTCVVRWGLVVGQYSLGVGEVFWVFTVAEKELVSQMCHKGAETNAVGVLDAQCS